MLVNALNILIIKPITVLFFSEAPSPMLGELLKQVHSLSIDPTTLPKGGPYSACRLVHMMQFRTRKLLLNVH